MEWSEVEFGATWAEVYDHLHREETDLYAAVDRIRALAGDGSVLEFGIGTGRLALPLARAGVSVSGVDSSPAMLDLLRRKPGAEAIETVTGDFSDVRIDGQFDVVLIALNTISYLLTQDDQVRCVANAARHLPPGGTLVVEALVPSCSDAHSVRVLPAPPGTVALYTAVRDPVSQRVEGSRLDITPERIEVRPEPHRYVWPSELDLMARLAGLQRRDRWGGWSGEAFTSSSHRHVSTYASVSR